MPKAIDWESRIGRRLRLRDLHVFFAVERSGSMAKAAASLGVTQPAVSKAVADLEATLAYGCSTAARRASNRRCTAARS